MAAENMLGGFIKYVRTHNGFARVYYRHERKLYCFQLASVQTGEFEFAICSRDGEPSHRVKILDEEIPLSKGNESTDRELNEWLYKRNINTLKNKVNIQDRIITILEQCLISYAAQDIGGSARASLREVKQIRENN